jgi:hypothetical protein
LRQGGERTDDPRPPPTLHCQPNPAWSGQTRRWAATSRGRWAQRSTGARRRPPSTGMGPHRLERCKREEGARALPPLSSSTSRVVPEADSDNGRAKGRGRRVAVARVFSAPKSLDAERRGGRAASLFVVAPSAWASELTAGYKAYVGPRIKGLLHLLYYLIFIVGLVEGVFQLRIRAEF